MNKHFPRKSRILDATPQQLLDLAPEREAPVIAGYIMQIILRGRVHTPRYVFLYLDGGILENNPYRTNECVGLSETAVVELSRRAYALEKSPMLINRERCKTCGFGLAYCRCRIEEKEDVK